MSNIKIRVQVRVPTVNQYNELRKLIGWKVIDNCRASLALNNSLISVCALVDNEVIGIGRVVGDGALYFCIQDVIVAPKYQNQGVNHMIVEKIMTNIKHLVKEGTGAFVGTVTEQNKR
ncbi:MULTISPECIES: GNAT family N-acetyltransferase [Vibrio]|uniref:GNAT family N-acetyltransferase n=1 Tax=Vibrio TaxID=662 RepID=UPI0012F96D80|nr:GNAT family N-acetyltransferase [Vibrio pacinii]